MRLALVIMVLFLSGCASKGVNTTLFLREESTRLKDLKGIECSESGYQVMKDREQKEEDRYILIVFYSNCDIHKERLLKEFELPQWGVKPKGSIGIQ